MTFYYYTEYDFFFRAAKLFRDIYLSRCVTQWHRTRYEGAIASSCVVKVITSFYRDDDQGSAFEWHRGRVPFDMDKHNTMEEACRHLIELMEIKGEGRTGVSSWCMISWFYFPWNVNLGNYSSWLVTWRFCMTHEEPEFITYIRDFTILFYVILRRKSSQ